MIRKLAVEFLGTAILVFFAVGVATLMFGFRLAGASLAAGVVATALAFGLTLLALVYIDRADIRQPRQPRSHHRRLAHRAHTAGRGGRLLDRPVRRRDRRCAASWGLFSTSPFYHRTITGLGTYGWGKQSDIHIGLGGAFVFEIILTALFVFIVLRVTSATANAATAAVAIGLTLTVVHLIGIPVTGTSVNPARSLGPALVVGGTALSQVWLFIVAPLIGACCGLRMQQLLYREESIRPAAEAQQPDLPESRTSSPGRWYRGSHDAMGTDRASHRNPAGDPSAPSAVSVARERHARLGGEVDERLAADVDRRLVDRAADERPRGSRPGSRR